MFGESLPDTIKTYSLHITVHINDHDLVIILCEYNVVLYDVGMYSINSGCVKK